MPVVPLRSLSLALAAPLTLGLLASTGPGLQPAEQPGIPLPDLDGDGAPEHLLAPPPTSHGPSLAPVLSGREPLFQLAVRPGDTPLRAAPTADADADGAPDLLITFLFTDPLGDAYEIDATYAAADGFLLTAPDPALARLVRLAADLDGNGRIDAADAAILLDRLRAGDPTADLNADGRADARDLLHLRAQLGRSVPDLASRAPGGGPIRTEPIGGGGTPGGGTPGGGGGGTINPADPRLNWEGNTGDGTRPPDDDDDGDGDDDECDGAVFYTNNDDDDFDALFDKDEHALGAAGLTCEVTDEDDFYGARISPPTSLPSNTQSTRWRLNYPAQLRFWYRPDAGDILDDAVTPIPDEQRTRRVVNGVEWILLPPHVMIEGPMQSRSFAVEAVSPSGGKCDLHVTVTHISTYTDANGEERQQTNTSALRVASAYEIAIEAANGIQATHLDIGHWGADGPNNTLTGYDASNTAYNSATDGTFIEGDPDRFRIRIVHHGLNKNPDQRDRIPAPGGGGAWGLSSHAAYARTAAEIDPAGAGLVLRETGDDTGVFVSEDQLLVCQDGDVQNPDDQFQVYSEYSGQTVADEATNDRTHQATVDGAVRFASAGLGARFERWCPVSDRLGGPGEMKVLKVRVRVYYEPFKDEGFDHDANGNSPEVNLNHAPFDVASSSYYYDSNNNGARDTGEPPVLLAHDENNNGQFDIEEDARSMDVNGNGQHDAGEPYCFRGFDFKDTNGSRTHNDNEPSEEFLNLSQYSPFDDRPPVWVRGDALGDVVTTWGLLEVDTRINEHMTRANTAWAQAGIRVEREGDIIHETAPHGIGELNVFYDGDFDREAGVLSDEFVIADSIGEARPELLEVIVVPRMSEQGTLGWSRIPAYSGSEKTFLFIHCGLHPQLRVLAHEIGHALTNREDLAAPNYMFFPRLEPADEPYDANVASWRRITHSTEDTARTARQGGQLFAPGNRFFEGQ